jgi:hypothetical protein
MSTGQGEKFIYALPCYFTGQGRTPGQGRAGQARRALEISQSSFCYKIRVFSFCFEYVTK